MVVTITDADEDSADADAEGRRLISRRDFLGTPPSSEPSFSTPLSFLFFHFLSSFPLSTFFFFFFFKWIVFVMVGFRWIKEN